MQLSLIEISVENYKIFKNKTTFSMVTRKSSHSFTSNGENLLKNSLIYGPNASGKSTILQAASLIRKSIINSANNNSEKKLSYPSFILSEETKDLPVFLEIVFSLGRDVFKYNFSMLKNIVVEENLIKILSSGVEKKLIVRKSSKINVFLEFKDSEDVRKKTREDVLFLSAAAQWNNKVAIKIVESFKMINVIQGFNSSGYSSYTLKIFKQNSKIKDQIIDLLRKVDLCIEDISIEQVDTSSILDRIKENIDLSKLNIPDKIDTVVFSHAKFNSNKKQIGTEQISMSNESVGTRNFFNILGPIIDTLENGKVLFIDELDNSLHPFLTKFILDMFEKNNPNNAQLIVTTHDTSLLSYKDDFDRSQFWFTEKDNFGVGKLFSLAEFKMMRNDTEFLKKYFEGRFGALPFIESLENITK